MKHEFFHTKAIHGISKHKQILLFPVMKQNITNVNIKVFRSLITMAKSKWEKSLVTKVYFQQLKSGDVPAPGKVIPIVRASAYSSVKRQLVIHS